MEFLGGRSLFAFYNERTGQYEVCHQCRRSGVALLLPVEAMLDIPSFARLPLILSHQMFARTILSPAILCAPAVCCISSDPYRHNLASGNSFVRLPYIYISYQTLARTTFDTGNYRRRRRRAECPEVSR